MMKLPQTERLDDIAMCASIPVRSMRFGLAPPTAADGPDLASYDVVVGSISGGKDSLAAPLATIAALGVLENPPPFYLVHSDLGDVEWPGVTELVGLYAERLGIELRIVRRQGTVKPKDRTRGDAYRPGEVYGDIVHHMERNGFMFRAKTRACTSDHKRGPIGSAVTSICSELRGGPRGRQIRCLNVVGLRASEGPARNKLAPFSHNKRFSSSVKHVDEWLIIHSWSKLDVWRMIWESGLPWHWAYDAGLPRLSCVFCILAGAEAWRIGAFLRPSLAVRYAELEYTLDQTLGQDTRVGVTDVLVDVETMDTLSYAREHGHRSVRTWEG